MRSERWYWLLGFCCLSLGIHFALLLSSRSFTPPARSPRQAEMEVALEPLPGQEVKPSSELTPKPQQQVPSTPQSRSQRLDRGRPFQPAQPALIAPEQHNSKPVLIAKRVPTVSAAHVRTAPDAEQGGIDTSRAEKPLPLGLPSARKAANAPLARSSTRAALTPGGGSPAHGPIPDGHDGASIPAAQPDDLLATGSGAGGVHLPMASPRLGGGGGISVLSVQNPQAKEAVPEVEPGRGPGPGGGEGMGAGAGAGSSRGQGIGARLDGTNPLATLRSKPGSGIGAGQGDRIGTHPAGDDQGTGAELPGSSGSGVGYGRGRHLGVGPDGGIGKGSGEVSGQYGLARGVPFGDVTGLLRGDPSGGGGIGGGPGGQGRGDLFGLSHSRVRGSPIHIVYLLDSSGSMRIEDKIGKAEKALKLALSELKRTDSFDIIHFDREIYPFAPALLPATHDNIRRAMDYVDKIELDRDTFLSGALETALAMKGVTHIFVLSDGEPNGGIEDFEALRAMVRAHNRNKVQINTLALGLGERFRGMILLKALAADNSGSFTYVNLAR